MAGLSGLLGALLFFAGDMLFYGYFGSGASFPAGMLATVAADSSTRLVVGGLLGMPAACLCILGFWHVRGNVKSSSPFLRRLMFLSFAALMVAGSAIHTLWTARGLAIKYCSDGSPSCSAVSNALHSYWSLAYTIGSVPGYLGAVLLILLVALRKDPIPQMDCPRQSGDPDSPVSSCGEGSGTNRCNSGWRLHEPHNRCFFSGIAVDNVEPAAGVAHGTGAAILTLPETSNGWPAKRR